MISFEVHVEQMWTVDLQEYRSLTLNLIGGEDMENNDDDVDGEGSTFLRGRLVVVIQLKSFTAHAVASRLHHVQRLRSVMLRITAGAP